MDQPLPLIPNLSEKLFPRVDLRRSFHSLRRTAVNHAHHTAPLFGFCNDHFHWVGARAENRTHLGYVLHEFSRFMGYASRRMRINTCPQARAWALAMAAFRSSSSLPSARIRHGPEDSLKASPNLACGTVFTTASYMSSAVLMKCVWPIIMLVSSGNFIRTDSSSIMASFQRAGDLRISF